MNRTISPLEQEYFEWLCRQVNVEFGRLTQRRYTILFSLLHQKEFVWTIANDDNRCEDAMDLRGLFLHEHMYSGPDPFRDWCSVLEVLVGLSRRIAFAAGETAEGWAWRLIENLELHKFSDFPTPRDIEEIDERLDVLIWRRYNPDGMGGFFPLAFPDTDQTKVEIWYQMCSYIDEIQEP